MKPLNNRPATAPILIQPAQAIKAHLTTDQKLSEAGTSIEKPSGLLALFSSKQVRKLRSEVDAIQTEHAAELALTRTNLAHETIVQAIDLNRKQQLASLAYAETETTVELTKQAQNAGARAIINIVGQEHLLQKGIAKSNCFPADKLKLTQFLRALTEDALDQIAGEHSAPVSDK